MSKEPGAVHNEYEDLLRSAVDKYLDQLRNKSVVEKIEQLFARCQPPAGFKVVEGFTYDPERLREIDRLRQGIIHGNGLLREINDMTGELRFLECTTVLLQGIVQQKYGLKTDPEYWARLIKGEPTA